MEVPFVFPALDCQQKKQIPLATFSPHSKIATLDLACIKPFRSLSHLLWAREGTMLGKVTGALPSSPLPGCRMCGPAGL